MRTLSTSTRVAPPSWAARQLRSSNRPSKRRDTNSTVKSLIAARTSRHRQTSQHSRLIPLDEPILLWYSSFWVQLQLIPVLACAQLPPPQDAQISTILVQYKSFICNTSSPL